MRRCFEVLWPVLVFALLGSLLELSARAEPVKYSGRLNPSDYLMGSKEEHRDPVFDNFKTIELGANIGVGSDCGRIDVKSTLRASLQNVLDAKYFGDMGKDILAASPMLLTCYFSPTWCAILKHSQVSANFLSKMRLDQCSIMDKYTDSRVDDFYQERQTCVRKSIEQNGGNLERAMESCRGSNVWNSDLANWAGSKNGEKATSNKLIDSSAKWARLEGPEAKSSVDLVKALVGDTVVSRGSVSVEYGARETPLTPRTYLQSIEKVTFDKLCGNLVKKIEDANGSKSIDLLISDEDLKDLSPNSDQLFVDRQTLRSLAYMNPKQRGYACKKLSDAVSMSTFSSDLNRSLDVLTTLSQNPNLPPLRKQEIEEKRRALKEQVELTIDLKRERNEPINKILSQINEEGRALQTQAVGDALQGDESMRANRRTNANLMDCSDAVMCSDTGR